MKPNDFHRAQAAIAAVIARGKDAAPVAVQQIDAALQASAALVLPKHLRKKKESKYKPHQGKREMARRVRQDTPKWLRSAP